MGALTKMTNKHRRDNNDLQGANPYQICSYRYQLQAFNHWMLALKAIKELKVSNGVELIVLWKLMDVWYT